MNVSNPEPIIDTLSIHLQGWELSTTEHLTEFANKRTKDIVLYDYAGVKLLGHKAVYNGNGIHVDIERDKKHPVTRAYVRFSAPKIQSGTHNLGDEKQDIARVLDTVQKQVKAIGIETDLNVGKVVREDVCRNIITNQPHYAYKRLFELFQPTSRLLKKTTGDTYSWENTQWEICIYDKIEELKSHKDTKHLDWTHLPDTSRVELRALNGDSVKRRFGVEYVSDLHRQLDNHAQIFRVLMTKHLFSIETPEAKVGNVNDLRETMRSFQNAYNEDWVKVLLPSLLSYYIDDDIGVETFSKTLQREILEYGTATNAKPETVRQRICRERQRTANGILTADLFADNNEITLLDMFNEWSEKVTG